jgi:alkylated DNA repair protein (DNA oxidative demethylase)
MSTLDAQRRTGTNHVSDSGSAEGTLRPVTPPGPPGLRYVPDLLSADDEAALLPRLRELDFASIQMRGQIARRRTVHFGWVYGYESWQIAPGPALPAFLEPLRERAAALAGVEPGTLAEALLTEYPAGAGIGWHRDAPQFGLVVGVSLLGACRMRFQRGTGAARQTHALELAPRSAYVLDGAVRWQWQHSIPPTKRPRYSVTFRTLRERRDSLDSSR